MASLRDNINKAYADQQKLRNAAPSQGISPLTERTANNNRNADSLKMAGTQQAQQGAMTQLAKDPQAVQTGALAQQQELEAQQRYLRSQQSQPQAGVQSIEDFQSDAIEKAQENVSAQAQELNQKFAAFGSLGSRIGNAVMEEMAKGGEVAAAFERDDAFLNEATDLLAKDGVDSGAVKSIITEVLGLVEEGRTDEAMQLLGNEQNLQLFKTGDDEGSAQTDSLLDSILKVLKIDPEAQQGMISTAIIDGIINPDELTLGFLLENKLIGENDLGMGIVNLTDEFGPNWRNMTVSQITEAVEKLYEKETKDKARILKQLQDPRTDASIKRELRRELQMLDASGVSSAYEAYGRSVERTKQIDKIAMGGELKNIDEVLDDEKIKDRTDALIEELRANPDKVQSILAEWKEDNPGYEDMGDWILERQQELIVKGEDVTSSSDLLKTTNKKAMETVTDNELFKDIEGFEKGQITEAHKAILEEFGLVTDLSSFGTINNQELMDNDPIFAALLNKKSDSNFENFMNTLITGVDGIPFKKEYLEGLSGAETKQEIKDLQEQLKNPNLSDKARAELQEQLNAAQQKLVNNFEAIYDLLSNEITAKEFLNMANLGEGLSKVDFTKGGSLNNQYNDLFEAAFGSDHELSNVNYTTIQGYFDKFETFKNYLLTDDEEAWYARNKNKSWMRLSWGARNKRARIKEKLKNQRLFGLSEQELKNMRDLEAIFDTDGDGHIDSPETIKQTLMGEEGGMFADGFNLKDVGSDAYEALNNLLNNSDMDYDNLINTQIEDASDKWNELYGNRSTEARTFNNDIDNDEPWVADENQIIDNPKLSKLPSFGLKGNSNWQDSDVNKNIKQHANVINALARSPNLFDTFVRKKEINGIPVYVADWSEWKNWFSRNIGGWSDSFKKAMIKAGANIKISGKTRTVSNDFQSADSLIGQTVISEEQAFYEGVMATYGSLAEDIRSKRSKYNKNKTLLQVADKGNPYANL